MRNHITNSSETIFFFEYTFPCVKSMHKVHMGSANEEKGKQCL